LLQYAIITMRELLGCPMNYKVTEQYSRGEEKLIAEFNELNEARLFIIKKSYIATEERKKNIYRMYDCSELLHELNKENVFIAHAKYAEGNGDFNNTSPFIFQLMVQPINSMEQKIIAQFNEKNDIYLFINVQCEDNSKVNDNDLFLIFKNHNLIDTINKTIIVAQQKESSGLSSNEKGSAFKLSFSTRPTPGGDTIDYWDRNEEDDENIK
jgi:hypothetical protein